MPTFSVGNRVLGVGAQRRARADMRVFAEGPWSEPFDEGRPPRGQCGQEENRPQGFGKRG